MIGDDQFSFSFAKFFFFRSHIRNPIHVFDEQIGSPDSAAWTSAGAVIIKAVSRITG
jgi:hypothetical protein